MKYSKEFLEANARLKTLDEETLNDELNKMSFDELLEHRDYMIQQELGEENQLSEEEAQEQIEELLQMTREPSTDEIQPIKIHTHRTGKRIAVLIAAILILVSVFTVAAVASKRDFSILNGIVRFEDGKVFVSFHDSKDDSSISMKQFELDLEKQGFENLKLPLYFFDDNWIVENSRFNNDDNTIEATARVTDGHKTFSFQIISHFNSDYTKEYMFQGVEGGVTIQSGNTPVYLFDHGNNRCELNYFWGDCAVRIKATMTVDEMREVAESVK